MMVLDPFAMTDLLALRAVKTLHTLAWAIFAGAILAMPVFAAVGRFRAAWLLAVLVLGECLILAGNRMRCPLSGIAERYTADRRANFDIYLPAWLARHNKAIFGSLYTAGLLWTLFLWLFRS